VYYILRMHTLNRCVRHVFGSRTNRGSTRPLWTLRTDDFWLSGALPVFIFTQVVEEEHCEGQAFQGGVLRLTVHWSIGRSSGTRTSVHLWEVLLKIHRREARCSWVFGDLVTREYKTVTFMDSSEYAGHCDGVLVRAHILQGKLHFVYVVSSSMVEGRGWSGEEQEKCHLACMGRVRLSGWSEKPWKVAFERCWEEYLMCLYTIQVCLCIQGLQLGLAFIQNSRGLCAMNHSSIYMASQLVESAI
jgi:hypothetical protein